MRERNVLDHAWTLIERAEDWTQTAAARDQEGAKVDPDAPEACRWCAIGAVEKAVADLGGSDALLFAAVNRLCDAAKELFETRFLTFVNDRQDHDAMRRLFARALANSERAEIAKAEADNTRQEVERLRAMLAVCLTYIGGMATASTSGRP
ncbi:MAG: hypothetical protein AAGA21_09420 [Pseudomonadota bacterium]